MSLPERVCLVEVGPRDGLQNEATFVPTEVKLALVERLADAGLTAIETTSFVSPRWVPQMADHTELMQRLVRRPGVRYPVLVPNMQGFENARAAGATEIAVFAAATESFSKRNINCTIAESLTRFEPVCAAARQAGIAVRGYVSVVLGCPYEGLVDPRAVADVAGSLRALGCDEISLGDTIGVGTPHAARRLFEVVADAVPLERLAAHFHDTYGQALANLLAVLELGVTTVDAAVAGLGGCPYACGATGNVATEDVLYMLDGLGVTTGVDLRRLARAGQLICDALQTPTRSRAARALAGAGLLN